MTVGALQEGLEGADWRPRRGAIDLAGRCTTIARKGRKEALPPEPGGWAEALDSIDREVDKEAAKQRVPFSGLRPDVA
jgi:hypothetical protein